jgi:hypothetical protein
VRPKPRHLLLLAVATGLGWLVAPALSHQRYVPEPVDFEQRLPTATTIERGPALRRAHAGHLGEGPVTYRSGTIAAPQRFDLAGLAGELRPLELRARGTGGEWSEWATAANGDPVYFGTADELQVRARGWRPKGKLHYVNVSGSTTELGGLVTEARKAVNSAFISASGIFAAAAEAAPARPDVIGRRAWGADRGKGGCPARERAEYGRVKAGVVHHTVSPNGYSESEAPGIVLGICRYHRNGNGWNDIGYNALVDRFGNIYAGRAGGLARPVIGAHAQGFNAQTTGVAVIGNHSRTPVSAAARSAVVSWLSWKLASHRVDALGRSTLRSAGGEASRYSEGKRVRLQEVIGHRAVGLTECPGGAIERKLTKIRRQVRRRISEGGEPKPPSDPAEPKPTGQDGGIEPR